MEVEKHLVSGGGKQLVLIAGKLAGVLHTHETSTNGKKKKKKKKKKKEYNYSCHDNRYSMKNHINYISLRNPAGFTSQGKILDHTPQPYSTSYLAIASQKIFEKCYMQPLFGLRQIQRAH